MQKMKFREMDQRYFEKRKRFSEKYGPRELWSVMDHWALYCGIANLARCLAMSDILRETLDVPGHVAEFGSWRGANLMLIAKLLRIYDPHSPKVVHCFDSFEGLTEFKGKDAEAISLKGFYKGSLEELTDVIGVYDLSDEIFIHQGLIEETLPAVLNDNKALTFSFVYCDADLYEATKTILHHVHPRLAKGGVFVFDEWNVKEVPGEGVAVNEFLNELGEYYEVKHILQTRSPSLLMRKIKS